MSNAVLTRMPDAAELAAMDMQHVAQLLRSQAAQIEVLRAQIEWFRRQIFGQKSERYAPLPDAQQMHLGQWLGELMPGEPTTPAVEQDVPAHKRRRARSDFTDDATSVPFFDEARVLASRSSTQAKNRSTSGLACSSRCSRLCSPLKDFSRMTASTS